MEVKKKSDGIDLIEKKKKKKKSKRDEVLNENRAVGVTGGSMEIDKSVEKKKKNKRHEIADGVEFENGIDSQDVVKVKKKKIWESVKGIASLDAQTGATNVKGSVEIDTGVNKKKKRIDEDMRSEETHVMISGCENVYTGSEKNQGDDNVSENNKSDGAKKKTKKKECHEADVASEKARNNSMDVAGSSEVDTGIKKKKKHRKAKEFRKNSVECEINESKKKKEKDDRLGEETDGKKTKNKGKSKRKTVKTDLKVSADDDHGNLTPGRFEKVKEKEGSKKVKKRKRRTDATDSSKKSKFEKKRVRFSDIVDVITLPEHLKYRKLNSEGDLVQGKRYTPEEDAKIIQAVDDFIIEHGLASDGVDRDLDENWKKARSMIMNCKKHPELKNIWKDISVALPWRTVESVYQRAHLIFERAEDRKWSKEEIDMILSFHEKHGPKWRELGDFLGKSRKHVKDAYRRNKLTDQKKGAWSQEEYHKLFELVNRDVCIKAVQEKKVKHGMLRDNIAWGAISETLGTRASPTCCRKWYYQICSSMVLEGKWSDTDDYKLVDALFNLDACCIEDVEWGSLLEHRSGDLCQKRWAEMARNLGEYRNKPFLEQVEVLHERYDRALIEAREIYEKKDPVDV